jgi:hypothetical protein
LVVEELGDELLVYDRITNQAHCLTAVAARVWQACDGEGTTAGFAAKLDLPGESVMHALAELEAKGLLQDTPHVHVGGGMTRREVALKTAKVGAAAAAVPLIWSVAGPIPEAAATPTIEQCAQYHDKDCDGCRTICGCCCCCQAGDCKTCFPRGMCNATDAPGLCGGNTPNCSADEQADCSPVGTVVPCKPPNASQTTRPCCTP